MRFATGRHGKADIPYILNYTQRFAPYLSSEKLLAPMRQIFQGQHVRMRTNKGFVHPPRETPSSNIAAHGTETDHLGTVGEILRSGGLHADGPFIQSNAVRVAAPYPMVRVCPSERDPIGQFSAHAWCLFG